jgi:hypothetical protein
MRCMRGLVSLCSFLMVMLAVLWCALLLLVCTLTHVRVAAQNPPLVVGPSLLDPLSRPRRWMGAASATIFSSSLGRQDYFGFAGGDTGMPGDCAVALQNTIDLYRSTLGGKPTPMTYQGLGRPALNKARSFASGASFFPPYLHSYFCIISLIVPLQVSASPSPPTQARGGMVTWCLPEESNAPAQEDNKPLEWSIYYGWTHSKCLHL